MPAPKVADGDAAGWQIVRRNQSVLQAEVLLALGAAAQYPAPTEIVGQTSLAVEQRLRRAVFDVIQPRGAASEHHSGAVRCRRDVGEARGKSDPRIAGDSQIIAGIKPSAIGRTRERSRRAREQ